MLSMRWLLLVAALLVPEWAHGRELARAWERSCAEVVEPVCSPQGGSVFGCDGRFDTARGRYGGLAPVGLLAVVDDARGIVEGFGERGGDGIVLVPLDRGREPRPLARSRGGSVEAIALAPDRARVASIERHPGGAIEVVVRSIPRLQLVGRVAVAGVEVRQLEGSDIAFSPTGELLVAFPCDGDRCAVVSLVRLDLGRLTPVVGAVGPARVAVFAPGGEHVAIGRAGGHVDVRSTAQGALEAMAELPDSSGTLALSPDRTLLAAAGAGLVRVLELGRAGARLALRTSGGPAIAFSPTGEQLFVGGPGLSAFATGGARVQRVTAPDLAITPPAGFVAAVLRDGTLTFPTMPGADFEIEPGLVAAWSHGGSAQVRVIVTEADEFVAFTDPERWGLAVAERYEPYSPLLSAATRRHHRFGVRREADGARSMELHIEGDGCDPSDRWVRIEERGEALVRTIVQVPTPLIDPDEVASWLRAFRFERGSGLRARRAPPTIAPR